MFSSELFTLLRKYGKYLGGVDYNKVVELLQSEDKRDREIERRLLMELSGDDSTPIPDGSVDDVLLSLEKRRLKAKLELLKKEEKRLLDIIAELKMRNLPRAEVKKALTKLRQVRREARQIRKLLKLLE